MTNIGIVIFIKEAGNNQLQNISIRRQGQRCIRDRAGDNQMIRSSEELIPAICLAEHKWQRFKNKHERVANCLAANMVLQNHYFPAVGRYRGVMPLQAVDCIHEYLMAEPCNYFSRTILYGFHALIRARTTLPRFQPGVKCQTPNLWYQEVFTPWGDCNYSYTTITLDMW